MPLDPQARAMIDKTLALNLPPASQMGVAALRANARERSAALPREDVASVRDHRIAVAGGELLVRVFTPRAVAPRPALVYFHGGGWVTGDVDTHEGICRTLANAAGCVVASVDYRCAPEHTFPTAAEDAYAATRWVAERASELGVDAGRVAVCGDSAGGNLAAAVALMARDRGGPRLSFQVLVYPITDCDFETPSYRENAEGYLLTREGMRWYWDQYVPNAADRTNPYVSPMRAASLAGLPPALVITAEYDPLRDEGEAYARKLGAAGVPVAHTRYPGMIHAFYRFTSTVDAARAAVAETVAALGKAWGTHA
ncbi:MAG: alpha/beta hydrolase [Candidatus Rokubacteria bacterium]|nr:alpha/beta hydrolase [Candidatus Rokubacteria bacterium]